MAFLHWFADQHCSNCGRTSNYDLMHATPLAVKRGVSSDGIVHWHPSSDDFRGLFGCNHCHQPHTLTFRLRQLSSEQWKQFGNPLPSDLRLHAYLNRLTPGITFNSRSTRPHDAAMFVAHEWGARLNELFEIVDRHPDSALPTPSALPPELASEFDDLRQVVGSTRHTVIACRGLLERACKIALGADEKNEKLVNLIEKTLNRLETVKSIADWAHAIRILGNEAVHGTEPPPSRVEAQEATEFTTLFLDLLFGYPERIRRLREK